MRPVPCIPATIEDKTERSPSEIIGEKSMFPIRKNPNFEKKFMYGSQSEDIIFPNFVNLAPGNQESKIYIKHKRVYRERAPAMTERIIEIKLSLQNDCLIFHFRQLIRLFSPDLFYITDISEFF